MSGIHTQPSETSELDDFTHPLRTLAPDDIRRHETQLQTTGDDLDWWQTTITVDRRLRDGHLSRRAAAATRAAREAVLATATRNDDGIDADVVAVARAAGDASCGAAIGWLEEFDDVAGGVLKQDLSAAGSFENVVAELSTSVTETGDVGFNVVHDEVNAVPAAGSRLGAIRHRPPSGARRSAEQQPQVAAGDVGERRHEAVQNFEVEELRVEGDGFVDVGDHIADIDHLTGFGHGFSLGVRARLVDR